MVDQHINELVKLQCLILSFIKIIHQISRLILVFLTQMIIIGIFGRNYFPGMLHFNEEDNCSKQGSQIYQQQILILQFRKIIIM
ncbi:unnamed protein product [Paramecium sonneborni]|uniref:Transmembrane protein n=1 Tax=Paramecium sonneborni TaxID=65129 RepID=A0A8S1QIT8_9CILI|nr:unnamed protein product [Paramecium sonneborni]